MICNVIICIDLSQKPEHKNYPIHHSTCIFTTISTVLPHPRSKVHLCKLQKEHRQTVEELPAKRTSTENPPFPRSGVRNSLKETSRSFLHGDPRRHDLKASSCCLKDPARGIDVRRYSAVRRRTDPFFPRITGSADEQVREAENSRLCTRNFTLRLPRTV